MALSAKSPALVSCVTFLTLVATASAGVGHAGTLDRSFGGDGRVAIALGSRAVPIGAGVELDGRVGIVALDLGKTTDRRPKTLLVRAIRLTRTGRIDRSFGHRGRASMSVPWEEAPFAAQVLRDGRVVLFGARTVIRLTASGRPDPAFGAEGVARLPNEAHSAAVQPDGGIVFDGTTVDTSGYPPHGDIAVGRLRPDGSLDESFGSGGVRTVHSAPDLEFPGPIGVRDDGIIVVAGSRIAHDASDDCPGCPPEDPVIVRLLPTGEDDPALPGIQPADALLRQPTLVGDGSMVSLGFFHASPHAPAFDTRLAVHRFTAAGKRDLAFGDGGWTSVDLGPSRDTAFTSIVDAAGRVVVGGGSRPPGGRAAFAVSRFTRAGRLDRSFGAHGWTKTRFARNAAIRTLALGPGGRILAVAGGAGPARSIFVARYLGGPKAPR
jgi:uncharacterized delta-60 repeat protein